MVLGECMALPFPRQQRRPFISQSPAGNGVHLSRIPPPTLTPHFSAPLPPLPTPHSLPLAAHTSLASTRCPHLTCSHLLLSFRRAPPSSGSAPPLHPPRAPPLLWLRPSALRPSSLRAQSPLVDVATPDASSLAAFAFFGLILFCVVASTLVDCIMPADETIDGGMRSPLPATRRTEGGALYKPLVDPNETPPGGGGAGTREERSVSNSGGTGGSSGDKDDPTNTNSNSNSAAAASAASAAAEPLGLGWQQQRTGFLWGVVDMFSATRNLRKLVRLPPPAAEETGALNGIRSVSMLWIILGHTFLMPQAIAGYDNVEDILGSYGAQNGPWIQIILGAEIAVDSFFYLSGFLLAWLTLDALDKKKGRFGVKGVCMATLYRYLRLIPSLAFALMIYYKMTQFASGNGPFSWRFQHSITRRCDTTWWVELTYAMNFYPYDTDAVCMGWTWYLGNRPVAAVEHLLGPKLPDTGGDGPRFADRPRVKVHVVQPRKRVDGLDSVVHIEAAGAVRQDELHVRVLGAVLSDLLLI